MTNPRLVPIPKRDARGRFVSQPPPAHLPAISSPTRAVPPLAWPLKSHDVAALLLTLAVLGAAWPYRHVVFLVASCYFLLRAWLWLCRHDPLAAWFLYGFLSGLCGRRRRRW
jgi:hypothetical protein